MTENPLFVKEIAISGFKSIKEAQIELKPINIIIGANGSGKSNLLSVFDFVRYVVSESIEQYSTANDIFYFGAEYTKNLHIGIQSDAFSYWGDFVSLAKSDDIKMVKGAYECRNNKSETFIKDTLKSIKVYHFHNTSPKATVRSTQGVWDNIQLHPDGSNIAAILHKIKSYGQHPDKYKKNAKTFDAKPYAQSYDRIIRSIKVVAPYFKDFILEKDNKDRVALRWQHNNNIDKVFSAHQLSDGTLRFILLATLLLQPNPPKIIIVDEPELGLHPDALIVLADMIRNTSKKTQVILTTQSVEFADLFDPEDFIVADHKDGESIFTRQNSKDLKRWLENDYGMGGIWNTNYIGGRP